MRKLISALLALVLVLSMATVAFAATESTPANFTKTYTINGGTAPAETFTYKFTKVSGTNGDDKDVTAQMPDLADVVASFADLSATANDDVEVSIDISKFPGVGVYVYSITEVDNNTAGVTYDTHTYYLKITIVREGDSADANNQYYVAKVHYSTDLDNNDKVGKFENSYDAGSLKITKEITGNMADMTKEFTFTVTLTPTDGDSFNATVQNTTTNTEAKKSTNDAGVVTYTFTLSDGENIVIDNIPTGTKYTVSENAENYTKTVEGEEEGTITSDLVQVDYTNELKQNVDTGITMDSVPFVLMLAVCAIAAVMFVMKRRAVEF